MALLWNGSGIWSNLEEDTQKTKCFPARLFLNWTYSLPQFTAQTHHQQYRCRRGSGAWQHRHERCRVGPRRSGTAAGRPLWRNRSHKSGSNYWWPEVTLSREGWVAFQCLNCWQQLSSSRGGERAFIPKAKIVAKSRSPLALWGCWLRGLHKNRCFQKGPPFPSVWKHRPWNPNGILPLAIYDKSSPVWWRIVPEAEAQWSGGRCPVEEGLALLSFTTAFNDFVLVSMKWNWLGEPLHNENQLMLVFTASAKKGWSELPSGMNDSKSLLKHISWASWRGSMRTA